MRNEKKEENFPRICEGNNFVTHYVRWFHYSIPNNQLIFIGSNFPIQSVHILGLYF